jgi:hypothetical protein
MTPFKGRSGEAGKGPEVSRDSAAARGGQRSLLSTAETLAGIPLGVRSLGYLFRLSAERPGEGLTRSWGLMACR